MEDEVITEIGIDYKGRLYVKPQTKTFPYIYLEAMEVGWDEERRYLFTPPPPRARLATSIWWFNRILAAAKEQGCVLRINAVSNWHNVSLALRNEIVSNFPVL